MPKYAIFYKNDTISITVSTNKYVYSLIYKCNSNNLFELTTELPVYRFVTDPFITLLHKMPKMLYVNQNTLTGDFYFNYIYNKKWYEYWKESCIKTSNDFFINKAFKLSIIL